MRKVVAALFLVCLIAAARPASAQPVRPPNGTYTYTLAVNGVAALVSTIIVSGSGETFTVGESTSTNGKRINIETTYSANTLLPSHYELHQSGGTPNSDLVADITPAAATFTGIPLSYHALPDTHFVMIGEGLIAYRIMLASVLLANNSEAFTLGALNGNLTLAEKVVRATGARPPSVPPGDLAIGIADGTTILRVWYNPQTHVTDEIDMGNTVVHRDSYDPKVGTLPVIAKIMPVAIAPAHYTERQVSFVSGDGTLSGSLAIPGTAAKYPAIIFVHGSGPGTRDGGVPVNPTFLDLANTLANGNIAVLRYDKHGIGKSTGTGTEDWRILGADVRAAIVFLKQQPQIDPQQIFILGHSEGGFIADELANDPDVRGIIEMAGPSIPMSAILAKQGLASMPPAAQKALTEAFAPYANIDPADLLATSRRPILLLQGGKDSQVLASDFPHLVDGAKRAHVDTTVELFPEDDHLFIRLPDSQAMQGAEIFEPRELDPRVGAAIIRWIGKITATAIR